MEIALFFFLGLSLAAWPNELCCRLVGSSVGVGAAVDVGPQEEAFHGAVLFEALRMCYAVEL